MADPTTLWEILNSEFVKSLTGSAAGALAGALAAQHIAERSKVREDVIKELRAVNAANTLVFSLVNAYLNLKIQHVAGMWKKFETDKAAAEKARATNTEVKLDLDLQTLAPPPVSMTDIKHIVLHSTTPPTRALALLDVLERTIIQLNGFLTKRNVLLETMKAQGGFDPYRYYGLRRGNVVDQTFETTLAGILSHTNECIYFGTNLAIELCEHGQALKAKLPKGMPVNVVTPDFSPAAQHIPPATDFPGWEKANFKKREELLPPGLNFWRSIPP